MVVKINLGPDAKKRDRKSKGKRSKRTTVSTNISKMSDEAQEDSKDDSKDDSQDRPKKYPRNRVKKKDQYRNQVIEDQFGVFEYDKDPDGYLKARKRMLNRKSKFVNRLNR